jgi:uncharacterized protein
LTTRFDAGALLVDTVASTLALPRCSDRDDQKFLELAHAAGAAALFTRDAAVLALANRCRRAGLFAILRPDEAAAHFGLAPG